MSAWGKKNGQGDAQNIPQEQWAYLKFNLEGDHYPYAEQPDHDCGESTRWEHLGFLRDKVLELWPDPLASMTDDEAPRSLRRVALDLANELGGSEDQWLRTLVDLAQRGAFEFQVPDAIAGSWHPLEFFSMLWSEPQCGISVAEIRRQVCNSIFPDTEDGFCADPKIQRLFEDIRRGTDTGDKILRENAQKELERYETLRHRCLSGDLEDGSDAAEMYHRKAMEVFANLDISRCALMRFFRREGEFGFARIPTFWGDLWRDELTDWMAGVEGVRDAAQGLSPDEAIMRYSDPGDWAEYERRLSSDGEDSPTAMKLWNLIQRRFEEHLWFGRLIARVVRGHQPFVEIRHNQFESGRFDYSASTFVDIGKEAVPVRIWRGADTTSKQNDVTSGSTVRTPGASQSDHLSVAQTFGSTQQPRCSGAELGRQLREWIDKERQSDNFPAKYKAEIELAETTGASRGSIRKIYDRFIPEAQRRVGPKKKSAF